MSMRTRVFQSGNSQAVRIPKEIQFDRLDVEYEIERQGDVIIIRPVGPPLTNVLERFAAFSDDFMAKGRPDQGIQEREAL
jgi:antitoxin VapB